MSTAKKLRQRLRTIPADFTWNELLTVVKGLGFKEITDSGGSYRCFLLPSGQKIFLHEPHPGSIVKRYALREVVAKLKEFGIDIGE